MRDVGGISGNVLIQLFGPDGNLKKEVRKKNIVPVLAICQHTGWTSGTYTWGGTAYLHLCSSQTALTMSDNYNDPTGCWAALGGSKWYYKARSGSGTINQTAATPYCQLSYSLANGEGTGIIKSMFMSGNTGSSFWSNNQSPGCAIILDPVDWIVKGSLDTLSVTWTIYMNGPFKTTNVF